MRAAGIAPAEPGTPEFDSYIGNGEEERYWAVLMDGRLVILPLEVGVLTDGSLVILPDEVEVPDEGIERVVATNHGALTGNVGKTEDWVLTTGMARIKKTDEGYQGIAIDIKSGHYHPTPVSLVLHGLPTFAEYGITFPAENISFEFDDSPPEWSLGDDARLGRESAWDRVLAEVEERLAVLVGAARAWGLISDETARELLQVEGESPHEAARRFKEALDRLRDSGFSELQLQGFVEALARSQGIGAEIRVLELGAAQRWRRAVAAATEGAEPGSLVVLDGFERAPTGAVNCLARAALRFNDDDPDESRTMQVPVRSITDDRGGTGAPEPVLSWLLRVPRGVHSRR